ncbi:zinc-ribbon-domain-containing protein [Protomyces lactucae-debilis]|uniref:Zinc-ribbon-domain-containing protein n=1 Tax=Protomyces lactucae-debilis TaxID=2754530 RepID=A0A1Y2ETG6_PROLT|nr:zinc-ribbon-domain-containing protein [Protomyces lactucae-debilis]ORY74858.1 zinc-ribbon-domain-containing protein [Protomyces lactucae-debilis]
MTQRYVSLSHRRDSAIRREIGQPLTALDLAKTYHNEAGNQLGCQHYRRNCKLECSTCHTIWPCRFCHDEQADHTLVRTETKTMLCMLCSTLQDAAQYCKNCSQCMALYYCDKCKLWDDDPEKPIYHCAKCKICRVGRGIGKDFFHCDKCNVCMAINRQDSHRCIEHSTECDCPICGEYMFSSTQTVVFMNCGHSIHQACYHKHIKTNYRCPTCSKSLRNMDSSFRMLDHQIAQQRMPSPYCLWKAKILCNDCQSRSTVPYHFLGHKCDNCLSYNVAIDKVIKEEGAEAEATPATAVEEEPVVLE